MKELRCFLRLGAVLAVVAASLSLAACGGANNGGSEAGGAAPTPPKMASAPAVKKPAPVAKPAAGTSASSMAGSGSGLLFTGGPAEGSASPGFDLSRVGSPGKLSLASLKGKVALVNFWATWCNPCVHEMPDLEKLHKQFGKQGLVVVGITEPPQDSAAEVATVRKAKGITYPLLTANPAVTKAYSATAIPQSYLVGRNGKLIKSVTGEPAPTAAAYWTPLIRKALASS
ncbi:MAG TPA: TlpA disulfide reductase family protein [Armatimonadota bacterium]|nr:TlpA disulfide reductase family protein [Armatimonadota bacterium]